MRPDSNDLLFSPFGNKKFKNKVVVFKKLKDVILCLK